MTTRLAFPARLVIGTVWRSSEWSPVVLTSTVADSKSSPPAAPVPMVTVTAATAAAITAW